VKKPTIIGTSTGLHGPVKDYVTGDKDSTVSPIKPPAKKRRREAERSLDIPEPEEESFADSLGAVINQARQGATEVWTSGGPSTHGYRRRNESTNTEMTAPSKMASSTGQVQMPVQDQAPILVNVADLQDVIVKTADQVVRQLVGDTPPTLLTAHTAVSMMTGYAASGQFLNNNMQLLFPSVCSVSS